ncbi:hypothetical protein ACO0KY_03045 [Undibacterium sp. Dicai25W]|uniref:hypothetical protein n=1 Tax=Undibacterium sp. Dicai25W TaxID=3413034 RepID=UPI003BF24393
MRHILSMIITSGVVLGCAAQTPAIPLAAASKPAAVAQIWHGELVRMGPEMESWLGLIDNFGRLWRLEKLSQDATQQLIKRQHQHIKVTGSKGNDWLSTPVIDVQQWSEEN